MSASAPNAQNVFLSAFSNQIKLVAGRGIEAILQDILEELTIDRIRISKEYRNGRNILRVLHEKCRIGVSSAKNEMDGVSIENIENYYQDLKKQELIVIENTEEEHCKYEQLGAILRGSEVTAYYAIQLPNGYIVSLDVVNSKTILSKDQITQVRTTISKIEDALSIILK